MTLVHVPQTGSVRVQHANYLQVHCISHTYMYQTCYALLTFIHWTLIHLLHSYASNNR